MSTGTRGAGNVTLNTDTLLANAGAAAGGAATEISSTSSNAAAGSGNSGRILLQASSGATGSTPQTVELTNTTVRTAVAGDGQGGALQLSGSNHLTLTNSTLATSVHNGTDATGTSTGDITLTTAALTGGDDHDRGHGTRNAGRVIITGTGTQPLALDGTSVRTGQWHGQGRRH